jgi:hypothetical protein
LKWLRRLDDETAARTHGRIELRRWEDKGSG